MTAADIVNPPIVTSIGGNYPATIIVMAVVLATSILLVVSSRFDVTHGELTISIMITLGMLGAVAYCLIFTIPADDITPGVVGGLTAGFGAVLAHWFGKKNGVPPSPPPPPPPPPPPTDKIS